MKADCQRLIITAKNADGWMMTEDGGCFPTQTADLDLISTLHVLTFYTHMILIICLSVSFIFTSAADTFYLGLSHTYLH